jgi:hypothetical protein
MIDAQDNNLFHLRSVYALRKEAEASRILADAAHADLANIAASIIDKYPDARYFSLCKPHKDWEYNPDLLVEDVLDDNLESMPDAYEFANDLLEEFDSPRMGIFAGIQHDLMELVQWIPSDLITSDLLEIN